MGRGSLSRPFTLPGGHPGGNHKTSQQGQPLQSWTITSPDSHNGHMVGHFAKYCTGPFPALSSRASPASPQAWGWSPLPPISPVAPGQCIAGGAKLSARVVQKVCQYLYHSTINHFTKLITAGGEQSNCSRMVTSRMVIDTRSYPLAGNPLAGRGKTL